MRCYCAAARRVSRRLTRVFEEELRSAGLTAAQFELLGHLRARPGVSQLALAEGLVVDQTTLSRNLKGMAAQGWVEATGSTKDKRQREYRLTVCGLQAFELALPLWRRAMQRVEESVVDSAGVWKALGQLERV